MITPINNKYVLLESPVLEPAAVCAMASIARKLDKTVVEKILLAVDKLHFIFFSLGFKGVKLVTVTRRALDPYRANN